MSHTPHELPADFPDHAERIHVLKTTDEHFARTMAVYHAVNREVHRAETGVEPIAPEAEAVLRKRRAALKDELYRMLTSAA